MSGKKSNDLELVEITKRELRALLFYAKVGIDATISGSYPDAPDIVNRLKKRINFDLRKAKFKSEAS